MTTSTPHVFPSSAEEHRETPATWSFGDVRLKTSIPNTRDHILLDRLSRLGAAPSGYAIDTPVVYDECAASTPRVDRALLVISSIVVVFTSLGAMGVL